MYAVGRREKGACRKKRLRSRNCGALPKKRKLKIHHSLWKRRGERDREGPGPKENVRLVGTESREATNLG